MICQECEEQGERQQQQMMPRDLTEGLVMVSHRDPFLSVGGKPVPDIRMGDIVQVKLIAGTVEDIGYCGTEGCENYRG